MNNFDPLFNRPAEVIEHRQSLTELAEVVSRTLVTAITDTGRYVNVFPTRVTFYAGNQLIKMEVK